MATPRLRCNLCEQPLAGHCPDSNYTCTWMRCTHRDCTADAYDWHRGTLRHADGRVEGWAEAELDDTPPVITINEDPDAQAG
jgi:hypothetical protein